MAFVTVEGDRFIDGNGRSLLLHGINLVNKDPSVGYLGPESANEFAAWRAWGLNCIRLGVIWDGLEPEPGVYNEAYLQGIDQQIAWATENDLFVILDMHQDLYSVRFADGAPEWATLTDDQPHLEESDVWSDAYFTSPAVHAAWNKTFGTTHPQQMVLACKIIMLMYGRCWQNGMPIIRHSLAMI